MKNWFYLRFLPLLLLTPLLLVPARAESPPPPVIVPGASCLACHQDLGGREVRHAPAATGFDCLTCHQPTEEGRHIFTPLATDQRRLCDECHAPFSGRRPAHAPVATGRCTACHDPHQSDQAQLLRQPRQSLCLDCHAAPEDQCTLRCREVREGECATCHTPHRSDQAALLSEPQLSLCLSCHEGFSGAVQHGPVTEGKCGSCHASSSLKLADDRATEPAGAEAETPAAGPSMATGGEAATEAPTIAVDPEATALTLFELAQPELCFSCHNKQQTDAAGLPLPATKRIFADPEAFLHAPFAKGRCSDCHRPHAGDHARLLTDPYPAGLYASYSEQAYAFCFQCHDSDGFNELRTTRHTGFRNGELNLHYRHVNRAKGRSCAACHSAHGSRQPFLIRETLLFGKRGLAQTFVRTETGGSCATACHAEAAYDREEPVANRIRTSPW